MYWREHVAPYRVKPQVVDRAMLQQSDSKSGRPNRWGRKNSLAVVTAAATFLKGENLEKIPALLEWICTPSLTKKIIKQKILNQNLGIWIKIKDRYA